MISPRSTLTLTTVGLVPHRLLSALPYPVLDPDAARTAAVTFVLPGGRDPAQLEAAGMVASWLGLQSRESGIHFNVAAIPRSGQCRGHCPGAAGAVGARRRGRHWRSCPTRTTGSARCWW
ncbi:cellulose biosynthesis cyclic di-GMP-binding regulatory protein BcsB [Komagataeibacter rhaeticus]|nr:cellulose biosynthesis cyclic di-GMP-binding regulatory protein BcsB [Komagataeibacter rhaeticus]